MFHSKEQGRKSLREYKNSKSYSYYKSGWLYSLQCHNLSGSKYCIIRRELRKSQSIIDLFHKLWIIFEKIRTYHRSCVANIGKRFNHVAAAMYRVKAAVRIGLTNPACTRNANERLPNWKTNEPKKLKDLDFSWEDFGRRGKKRDHWDHIFDILITEDVLNTFLGQTFFVEISSLTKSAFGLVLQYVIYFERKLCW